MKKASSILYTWAYIIGATGLIWAEQTYSHNWIGSAVLVGSIAAFSVIMLYQVTLPLRKLVQHIKELEHKPGKKLPRDFGGWFMFKEFECIADALDNFQKQNTKLQADLRLRNVVLLETTRKDALTGIHNRRAFDDDWEAIINGHSDEELSSISMLLIDCNNFKTINDTYGHETGDRVLVTISSILSRTVSGRRGDRLYRLGGDEFLVLLKNTNDNEAFGIGARCVDEVNKFDFTKFGIEHDVGISVGFSTSEKVDRDGVHNLKHQADMAMYRAKHGKNRYVVQYHASMGM